MRRGMPAVCFAAVEATVASWHDGDTVRVPVAGRRETVRLIGIDTPDVSGIRPAGWGFLWRSSWSRGGVPETLPHAWLPREPGSAWRRSRRWTPISGRESHGQMQVLWRGCGFLT